MVKKIKDKNAPKRPLTGFLLYGNYLRQNDSSIKELPVTQQAAAIAKYWKEMPEDEKNKYNQQSDVLKQAYKAEVAAYENSDAYREFKQLQAKAGTATKPKRKQGSMKMSGYRLFVKENKESINEGLGEEDSGKRHIAKCGIKWKKLSEEEQKAYNDRAALMEPEVFADKEKCVTSDENEEEEE